MAAAAAVKEAPQVRRAGIERPRPNWSEQSLEQGKLILPSPCLRLKIWSRETGSYQVHDITCGTCVSYCCISDKMRDMFYSILYIP